MPFKGDSGLADGMSPSYRARAARYAMRPLYRDRIDSKEMTVKMMLTLRRRWIALARRLSKEGWEAANTDEKLSFMLGCPPFGVNAPTDPAKHQVLRPCRKYHLCPFCYARWYPINAFDRLWPVLSGGPNRLLFLVTNSVGLTVAENGGFDTSVDLVRQHILSTARRADVDAFGGKGAVVFHRVRLIGQQQQVVRMQVQRTTLVVGESGRSFRLPDSVRTKARIWPSPVKKDLAAAVGQAFAYPAEWYAQTTETLTTLMTALSRARVFAAYGDCRRSAEPES